MACAFSALQAQTVIFSENFNDCALPAGWTVQLSGNPDAAWYIGTPRNPNSDSSSIDGSCMLIIDDDATGDNTPAWTLQLISPPFDITGWTTATVSMDVHFRNYDGRDSLSLWAFDGQNYHLLRRYRNWSSQTGEQFSQFQTFRADLSFFPSSTLQLVIRYDDGGTWAWWAGIDNIVVHGEGTARNLLLEQFNQCALPDGWTTEAIAGQQTWNFGELSNPSAWASSTMNGSCFAYIDDDAIGNNTPPFTARLYSPELDGSLASSLTLSFDVIYRTYSSRESFSVGVMDVETGQVRMAAVFDRDLGGPQLNQYVHRTVDLSPLRSRRMKFFFQYDDGGEWNWWIGIDNIKLSGEGELNDVCEKALALTANTPCIMAHNGAAIFDGPQPACSPRSTASLWYEYTAQANGMIKLSTQAHFNDVITVFEGPCDALVPLQCFNKDEHGFTGETLFMPVAAGRAYRFRVSGQQGGFGTPTGAMCIALETSASPPPAPPHATCEQAALLEVDGECRQAVNIHAPTTQPLPSRNTLARADVWFRFVPQDSDPLVVVSNADFADVITAYTGGCQNLQEVAINEYGSRLEVKNPVPGTTYWVRISGAFATIEGGACPQVKKQIVQPPVNDRCISALPVQVGGACVSASNMGADFDGPAISCEPFLSASIWFSFVAPASGSVRLLPDADFLNATSIYQGDCNQLSEVFCSKNTHICEGAMVVSSLSPGQTYLVRVSSSANITGYAERGHICLSIEDAAAPSAYAPLSLSVNTQCFGNGAAMLHIEAQGGQGPYLYQGNGEYEILQPGEEYVVVVTDTKGCERTVVGRIDCQADPNCNLSAQIDVRPPTCPGGSNGEAVVSQVEGGSGPYSYQWTTGATTPGIGSLAAGAYALILRDQAGCSMALPVTITAPTPAELVEVVIEPAVGAQANGRIALQITGGASPFTYTWYRNNEVFSTTTSPELSNAPAGSYALVLTDANGCSYSLEAGPFVIPSVTAQQEPSIADYTLLAFSNPTEGPLTLTWDLPARRPLSLYLYTAEGRAWRLAHQLPARMSHHHLNLKDWPSGAYFIRLSDGEQQWSVKVVRSGL